MLRFFQRIFGKVSNNKAQTATTHSKNQFASPVSVSYDEQGVRLLFESQLKQSITWSEIDLIAIRIEDDFLPFPYWYVGNQGNLLRIPNDAAGGKELFFDGFSKHVCGYKSDATFKVVIEASTAMEGAFVVWRAASELDTKISDNK